MWRYNAAEHHTRGGTSSPWTQKCFQFWTHRRFVNWDIMEHEPLRFFNSAQQRRSDRLVFCFHNRDKPSHYGNNEADCWTTHSKHKHCTTNLKISESVDLFWWKKIQTIFLSIIIVDPTNWMVCGTFSLNLRWKCRSPINPLLSGKIPEK